MIITILVAAVALIVLIGVASSVKVVRQSYVGIVERLGRYQRTLQPGVHILVPFLDRQRMVVDMKETVQPFPPTPVITQDNVTIGVDTIVYYQVTDPTGGLRRGQHAAGDGAAADHHPAQRGRRHDPRGAASPAAIRSTPSCERCWTRPPRSGGCGLPESSSSRSTRRARSRRRWSSRCEPTGPSAPRCCRPRARSSRRSCAPRAFSRRPSSTPRASSRQTCCGPRATARPGRCERRARPRRCGRSSR